MPGTLSKREELERLYAERENIEKSIAAQLIVLQNEGVGMLDQLVDSEGFPRADVNVHSIRTARSIIIRLRNDLKEIEVQISECVSEVFKEIEQQNSIEATNSEFEANSTDNLASGIKNIIKKPFLTVSGVHSSSPAYACGLKSGDRILSIGSVHQGNFISLETLSEYIKHYENKELFISIIRNEVELQLTLIPKVWSGRGLLGCHLTPS